MTCPDIEIDDIVCSSGRRDVDRRIIFKRSRTQDAWTIFRLGERGPLDLSVE